MRQILLSALSDLFHNWLNSINIKGQIFPIIDYEVTCFTCFIDPYFVLILFISAPNNSLNNNNLKKIAAITLYFTVAT